MIEVHFDSGGWFWMMISADGRALVWSTHSFPSQKIAFEAARAYRTAFWAKAERIDHRQARNI